MIRVQEGDFNIGEEIEALRKDCSGKVRTDIGAIVTFTGTVRDALRASDGEGAGEISTLTLEHYPGMTEKELARIEEEAHARWPLQASLIVHRVGTLLPGDNIVLVITASAHREAAFEAARFLMDYLKTSAPFWKRETGPQGEHWVEAKETDDQAAARWREE
ncbi:molybdopterin synthase catalytic subunit MoaE [Methyloceanibacter caenitepidi]|uniref:Molybdopterin synthase catalytic subunit n=1 Tax=Methyloceanibacter caenitepidi TaxID=1384459 RepID=A0A0A8K5P1_9HYPH|nr:molybdopterin synthase catalytic subunit MoaE [Methyloceanibacter caenitepidi]BAQ18116.1 molybdenum cofactor biosynthesis protein MoaE [Methyloceanibacter caenitepidi]